MVTSVRIMGQAWCFLCICYLMLHLTAFKIWVSSWNWNTVASNLLINALRTLNILVPTKRFDMLHLPGKRNRRVPMILKPEVVTAMDLLVKTRRKCQVQSFYFFAIPGKQSHIHPWKVNQLLLLTSNAN